MPSYTAVFGGNAVRSADQSLTQLTLSSNTTLVWPSDGGSPATSAIIEVNPTSGGLTLRLPDARNASEGETITIRNVGASSFSVIDNASGSVVTIATGNVFTIYLSDNSTAAGVWSFWQAGAGSAVVSADALDGAGLDAQSGLLRVKATSLSFSASQAFADSNRGSIATWTGGSGTFTVPLASSVGNGWYMIFKNAGSGTLQVASVGGETFDGATDITLQAGQGATVYCDGTNFSYVLHSAVTPSSFGYTSISVAGTGDYTLNAAEYAKNAIKLTGVLTGNRNIIVPTTVRDYWIDNSTTGAFTVTVKTAAGAGVAITQTKKATVYCDGVDVIAADTDYPSGISTPVSIANGGTGSTTAANALTALGGTVTGTAVFTAASAAAGRSAISAAATGTNTDITGISLNNTGLKVRDTDASNFLSIVPGSNLSADRTLTINTGDANRTLDISGGSVTISAAAATVLDDATVAAMRTTLGAAAIDSPAFTGNPTAPTPTAGDNDTSIATTAFVQAALAPLASSQTTYTSGSGTWTVPSSGTYVLVRMWGGGGSGCQTGAGRHGGGGGAYKEALYLRSSLGASVSYSVGAGGAAVSGTNGNPGGNTTFGSLTAYGGGGGGGSSGTGGGYIAAGGTGTDPGWGGSGIGTGANADLPWSGANGGNNANPGGNALYGGAGGGGVTSSTATAGGTSIFGGNGGAATVGGTAGSGSSPGGGGGACSGAGTSGAGGDGKIEIYVF